VARSLEPKSVPASASKLDAQLTLATIGYEGKELPSFIKSLVDNGIEMVVDVRQRAASRKRGFAKTALSAALADAEIDYRHLPELGTPASLRSVYRQGDLTIGKYLESFADYVDGQEGALKTLEGLIKSRKCCLLCFEADHCVCHRSVLAKRLLTRSHDRLHIHNIS
jgi:uncharacterized protein (DUF488 family)